MRRSGFLLVLLPLALAGCGGEPPPPPLLEQATPPLRYDYLTKLHLNVTAIDIQDRSPPPGPDDVSNRSPVPPAEALRQMAIDRLAANGSTGHAVFVIENASIRRASGDTLVGALAVRLDIIVGNGPPTAYAEARVSRSVANDPGPLPATLYKLTRQMMFDMNVEFEYQVRHSLKDWLQDTTPAATPAPVQAQPLGQPPPS
jgi:hypothetical protein